METRLKWNEIILAAKIILFHFRRGSMLKQNGAPGEVHHPTFFDSDSHNWN